jgi:cellulose synthase operon protein C
MRIVCEKCATPYAIDEAAIPPKGARAQCPKCAHLQVVRRTSGDFAPAGTPAPVVIKPAADPDAAMLAFDPLPVSPPAPKRAKPAAAAREGSCSICGKLLDDPFDAAIGTCEDCRAKARQTDRPESRNDSAPSRRTPAGLARGDRTPVPRVSPDKRARAMSGVPQRFTASDQPGTAAGGHVPSVLTTIGGNSWLIILVTTLVVLGIAAAVVAIRPAFLFVAKTNLPPMSEAVSRRLPGWKLALVGVSGSAEEHMAEARRQFLLDRPDAYRTAEDECKKAIVLNPFDPNAVAGLVEAFAVGRGPRAEKAQRSEFVDLITAAIRLAPNSSLVHRAYANLLLLDDSGDAREAAAREAEQAVALAKPGEIAEARLALGRVRLRTSAELANEQFEQALAKDPSLKRAIFYHGLAAFYAGHYAQAVSDLEKRLAQDPGQAEALAALGHLYVAVGDTASARKIWQRFAAQHPGRPEPLIETAIVDYQIDGRVSEAEASLQKLRRDIEQFEDEDKLRILLHSSAVARLRGDRRNAEKLARDALKIRDFAPAHFQLLLLALDREDATAAASELALVRGAVQDAGRVYELEARIGVLAKRYKEALASYAKAGKENPARVAYALGGGATAGRLGDSNLALSAARPALDVDPSATRAKHDADEYYEDSRAPLRVSIGGFAAMKNANESADIVAYSGILRYALGDVDAAAKSVREALGRDAASLPALLYAAQIALDRKSWSEALKYAESAAATDRDSPLAYFLQGAALEGQGKMEASRRMYVRATEVGATFMPAVYRQGLLAERTGDVNAARGFYQRVFAATPDSIEVRAALLHLGD